jgi:chaperone BCS1
MEDVDAAGIGQKSTGSVTFSGLLNTIDGIGTPNGVITILTTNHPEELEGALHHPGHVDVMVGFTYTNQDQVQVMFT